MVQVASPEYRAFLEYMCPGAGWLPASVSASSSGSTVAAGPQAPSGMTAGQGHSTGRWPPAGGDPAVCPRPVLGIYDDHDFGWNNGNWRLPDKDRYG
jgi:alkaline phosphatase D